MNFYTSKDNVIQTIIGGKTVNLDVDETNDGSIIHVELMKEDYIELHFNLKNPVYFPIGTYCIYNGKKYYTTKKQSPTVTTSGYQYSLKMDAYYMLTKNIPCMYDKSNGGEAGWSLTGNIQLFCNVFTSILAEAGVTYNGNPITFSCDSTVTSDAKSMDFSSVSIYDAINLICEKFECENWVTEDTWHFGKCEIAGDYVKLEEDDEIVTPSRSESSTEYANKIYAFGSDRNIPYSYRKHLQFTADKIGTKDGKTTIYDSTRPLKGEYFVKSAQFNFLKSIDIAANATVSVSGMGGNTITAKLSIGSVKKGLYEFDFTNLTHQILFNQSFTGNITYIINSIEDGITNEVAKKIDPCENVLKANHTFLETEYTIKNDVTNLVIEVVVSFPSLGFGKYSQSFPYSGLKETINGTVYGVNTTVTINDTSYAAVLNPDLESGNYELVLTSSVSVSTTNTFTVSDLVDSLVPDSYYTADEGYVKNGIVQNRLALPISKSYVDKDDLTEEEKNDLNIDEEEAEVSAIVIFDKEYPKLLSTISQEPTSKQINYKDSDGKSLNSTYPQYTLQIDKPTDFKDEYIISNSLKCAFQTGLLAGMEFGLQHNSDGSFTIEVNSDYGRQLPDNVLYPKKDDTLILFNYDTSYFYKQAISEAEQSLKATAVKYLKEKMFIDPSTYTCPMNMVRANGFILNGEKLVKDETKKIDLELGNKVNLICPSFIKSKTIDGIVWGRKSRVIGYEKKLDGSSCSYTVGESPSYSRFGSLESKVDSISFNGSNYSLVSGNGGTSVYLITSNDSTVASDTNAYSAKRSVKEFVSKLYDDIVKGNITFEQAISVLGSSIFGGGAEFGKFVKSMYAGTGASIDKDGNAEFQSVRVRSYFEAVEFIVNRLSAIEGDQLLTEADTIDSVDVLGNNCYGLHLHSKWDGYFTAQVVNNVLKGIINSLSSGSGTYYTSFMRVNSVNTATNYIEVTLYPDNEVPAGKNYPPCELMKIARWGNQTDTTRQMCLYLSSTEGRIVKLTGVTKPIIDKGNYGVTIGTPPEFLKSLNLPIREGWDYMYAPGIIYTELLHVDYQGNPIPTVVDRGPYDSSAEYYHNAKNPTTGTYEISDVWYKGCRYRCQVTGTKTAPAWNNTDWAMVEGNPNFTISFIEDEQMYDPDNFRAPLTIKAMLYNIDVTSDILVSDVMWTRYSEDSAGVHRVNSDNAWATKRGGAGKAIVLLRDDLDIASDVPNTIKFTATATLRDGMGNAVGTDSATIEI